MTSIRISVPKVTPIKSGGATSFSGVLKMEKAIDKLFANGGLKKYQVPYADVPPAIIRPGFESAATFKIPVRDLVGGKAKGTVFATRMTTYAQPLSTTPPGPNLPTQDHFALLTPKGTLLATRQKSSDYPAGFFWTNYRVR